MERTRRRTPPRLRILELERDADFLHVLVETYREVGTIELVADKLGVARQSVYYWFRLYQPPITLDELKGWASNGDTGGQA